MLRRQQRVPLYRRNPGNCRFRHTKMSGGRRFRPDNPDDGSPVAASPCRRSHHTHTLHKPILPQAKIEISIRRKIANLNPWLDFGIRSNFGDRKRRRIRHIQPYQVSHTHTHTCSCKLRLWKIRIPRDANFELCRINSKTRFCILADRWHFETTVRCMRRYGYRPELRASCFRREQALFAPKSLDHTNAWSPFPGYGDAV